jgi:UDP:flavonoid glycosyltransferase YjiC (YdhE family)
MDEQSMKFLFTMHPAFGHFHAMVPLAQACKEHGHEVAFATGKSFGPVIRRNGYLHFPCGLDFDGSTDIFEALPEWSAVEAKHPTDGLQQLYGFIQELAPRMADDLIELVGEWQPDAIVRDPVEFGGYIAAEFHKLPHATPIWATYISAKALCSEAVGELRRRYPLPDDPGLDTLDRYLVLDFLPPSWTVPDLPYPRVAHRFCAPPFDLSSGDVRLPDWLSTLPHQPTVYATLGTTFNRSPNTFQAILSALSTEPVNLIMTVGRSMDPLQFGPQPDHVRIEQYIPQTLLLPHCDALIFHGGYNSLQSAFWHGLPMVIIPQGAGDNLPTGWRCAAVGAGMLVEGTPPQPEAIRAAVKTILELPDYRARSQEFQREIKELPSLAEAVRRLEILAEDRSPQFCDRHLDVRSSAQAYPVETHADAG